MAFKVKKEEGNKGTDTAFLMLNEISGAALLKLAGVKDPEKYQGKATVLKEKMVKPDLECWPALEKEDGEPIRGVIVYTAFKGVRSLWLIRSIKSDFILDWVVVGGRG